MRDIKKNLLNRDCFGRLCPTLTNQYGSKYEVHYIGNGFEITRIDPYSYSRAQEYDHEGFECDMFLLYPTPTFKTIIHATRYMLQNAKYLL